MSAKFNLDQMSYADLIELSEDVQAAIKTAKVRELSIVRTSVQKLAEQHGLSLADLLGRPRRSVIRHSAKYVNPHDPSQTWSGRGRRPHWYNPDVPPNRPQGLKSGRSPVTA